MSSSESAGIAGIIGNDDCSNKSGRIPLISSWITSLSQRFQHCLDKATPFVLRRWVSFGAVALIYIIRVAVLEGFYIVSYGLGIYVLNLFIAFLSPQVDPELQLLIDSDGPSLPTRSSDEFRPFVRRLPEFKFWLGNYSLLATLQALINESSCNNSLRFFLSAIQGWEIAACASPCKPSSTRVALTILQDFSHWRLWDEKLQFACHLASPHRREQLRRFFKIHLVDNNIPRRRQSN